MHPVSLPPCPKFCRHSLPLILLFCFTCFRHAAAQDTIPEEDQLNSHIFMPSLEIGYMINSSDLLSGGLLTKTSLEYRIRNNNDVFFRLNYDAIDARYEIETNGISNVVEGKVGFSDLIGGMGYRFGDNDFRIFVLAQAGVRFYTFPVLENRDSILVAREESRNLFTTRFTLGLEYYIDQKTAFTVELAQGQMWKRADFWQDGTGSFGITAGVVTTIF